MTEVKTVLTDVRTEMDELKASVKDMKLANEAVRSKGRRKFFHSWQMLYSNSKFIVILWQRNGTNK